MTFDNGNFLSLHFYHLEDLWEVNVFGDNSLFQGLFTHQEMLPLWCSSAHSFLSVQAPFSTSAELHQHCGRGLGKHGDISYAWQPQSCSTLSLSINCKQCLSLTWHYIKLSFLLLRRINHLKNVIDFRKGNIALPIDSVFRYSAALDEIYMITLQIVVL